MDEEDKLMWERERASVTPLKKSNRVPTKSLVCPKNTQANTNHTTNAMEKPQSNISSGIYQFMGDCIEKELFAKDTIKLGNSGEITKISKAIKNKQNMDCLDLHGCYVENAKKEVANFCTECIENKTKFAKIIHGKKNGDVAKIKSALNQWLKNLLDAGYILGVKSIIDTSGQSGALIVSFRTKS